RRGRSVMIEGAGVAPRPLLRAQADPMVRRLRLAFLGLRGFVQRQLASQPPGDWLFAVGVFFAWMIGHFVCIIPLTAFLLSQVGAAHPPAVLVCLICVGMVAQFVASFAGGITGLVLFTRLYCWLRRRPPF